MDRRTCMSALEPLGYFEWLHSNMHAPTVITDSSGLQEETTGTNVCNRLTGF